MLTDRKRKYAEARVAGLNQADSARVAGATGTNVKSYSFRWERDPDVIAHRQRLIDSGELPKVKSPTTNKKGAVKKKAPTKKAAPAKSAVKKKATPKKVNAEGETTVDTPSVSVPEIETPPKMTQDDFKCPLDYMRHVMNDRVEDPKLRLEAANRLATYTVAKPGDKGKKESQREKADQLSSTGRFSAAPAPLRAVK